MATTSFFHDTRRTKPGCASVLKMAIAHNCTRSYVSLDAKLLPDQWDEVHSQVINHPNKQVLNLYLIKVKQQIDRTILFLTEEGRLQGMTANDIRDEVERKLNPEKIEKKEKAEKDKKKFAAWFLKVADSKSESTRGVFMQTYRRMQAFMGEKLQKLSFEDITKEWLVEFDRFMAQTAKSKNSRNIHLRNIRTVINDAIDNEVTSFYPFRKFKITPQATPKRNLKVDQLRTLFNFPCEEHAKKYIDMSKLMFLLIGINVVDLCRLKEIVDGRIVFNRAKTHRLYSIKVEPEALEIIERYRGENWLLDILDRYTDHNEYTRRIDRELKKIGPVKRVGRGGKKIYSPLFPKISTYWIRHSWATIAMSLDIPKDTISHALGHGNNTVTDIYIEFDQEKVDIANRKVIDWVFYGKR